ncbi:QacE family quaternary ammonium compound efflux SMR transporter [Pontibacillus yanchengensis]|uniref:QacE family quaternary ammonium compound efflux SMR transporter n=2 Tax=Pontibacillus yanchengensis TaxID=462910 RepID=A0ACC7VK61_9BACI|nr:multidrug efflux SMR transporter [Pontibacillus yanchengensis]MYL34638.1 QacE family quaternary ammonium compound efflux SMR transporter [Pontibacillus yanchengensis]MYL54505.1 QacE family quaternary ammonium compound efflux SMR transporter [Pontibacillus yanchengensis]
MAWTYVLIAGLIEIIWVLSMKLSDGFTNLIPSVVTVVAIVISFYFVSKSMEALPVGTAYAVFTGIGTIGAVVIEFVMTPDMMNVWKVFFILLLVIGIIGLKFTDKSEEQNKSEVTN